MYDAPVVGLGAFTAAERPSMKKDGGRVPDRADTPGREEARALERVTSEARSLRRAWSRKAVQETPSRGNSPYCGVAGITRLRDNLVELRTG
jgi:hypothetical protein